MLEEAKKLHRNISPDHNYWDLVKLTLTNVERLLNRKISIYRDPEKKMLALLITVLLAYQQKNL